MRRHGTGITLKRRCAKVSGTFSVRFMVYRFTFRGPSGGHVAHVEDVDPAAVDWTGAPGPRIEGARGDTRVVEEEIDGVARFAGTPSSICWTVGLNLSD